MFWWRIALARVASLFRRRKDAEFRTEIAGFLAERTEAHRRAGLSAEAARRAALLDVGGVAQVTEEVRSIRVGFAADTTWRDIRYGARALGRSPGYAVVVTLTMALGIGINASTFGVIDAVLWQPLPYPDAERVVAIETDARGISNAGIAPGEATDIGSGATALSHVAMAVGVDASVAVDGAMERVPAASATDDMLPLLGATPMWLGRPADSTRDEGREFVKGIVISYNLWQRLLHSDPHVIGRHIDVNNIDVEVVGVTRPDFRTLLPTTDGVDERVDVWFPRGFERTRAYREGSLIARLAPGASFGSAQAELDGLAARFVAADASTYPDGRLAFRATPLRHVLTRAARPALLAFGAAVGFVMLVACVNVASIMLARIKGRERELALRRALGASRGRIVRQLIAENAVLASAGALGGWAVARASTAVIGWMHPPAVPRLADVTIDSGVLWSTIVVTTVAGFVFSIIPAWMVIGRDAQRGLDGGRGSVSSRRDRRWQRGLVISEIALSIVPLVAAGLMARTFVNLTRAPLGFEPAHLLTAAVPLNMRRFADGDSRQTFYETAIARVRELPGVEAVSAGAPLPLTQFTVLRRVAAADAADSPAVRSTQVTAMPGLLGVVGIQLAAGRDFTADDLATHRKVAIIDEHLARALWHDKPLGRRISVQDGSERTTLEVIGVTLPIRTSRVRDAGGPTLFVPYPVYDVELSLVVKTHAPIADVGAAIKRAVEGLGAGRPVFAIRPLDDLIADSIAEERFAMIVLAGFAIMAIALTAVGLFGTLSYLVSRRTKEFGVRLALGASTAGLMRLVLREGTVLTGTGLMAGLAGGLGVATLLRSLLYGVETVDALTIVGVATVVAFVSMLAVGRPAWRAGHVDPVRALRD